MPVHKEPNGWYWGSKGPFDTRAQAAAVGRAAYANGYKGEAQMNPVADFALCLLHGVTNGHILHLRADSTAVHLAMGEFYTSLEELADSFIESYQGKYDKIKDYGNDYTPPPESPIEFMIAFLEEIDAYRKDIPQDTYLQNIVDEITQTTTSTLNKLRFYK